MVESGFTGLCRHGKTTGLMKKNGSHEGLFSPSRCSFSPKKAGGWHEECPRLFNNGQLPLKGF